MEHAVDQGAFQERDQRGAQQRAGVDPRGVHALGVVESEAGEPFHHEDASGHQARMRTRHDGLADADLRQHGRNVEHVLGFQAEVELLHDRLREELHQRRRIREGGDRDAPDHARPSHARARRSSCTRRATDGRCTLTTTDSPVTSVAACTCAIDAAASGSGEKDAKTWSSGRPRSDSTMARTARNGSAGTWSRSFLNSPTSSSGKEPVTAGDDLTELDVGGAEPLEALAESGRDPGTGPFGAALTEIPDAEGPSDRADDPKPPPQRRKSRRCGQPAQTGPGPRPYAVQPTPPGQIVEIDDPGWRVAEGAERKIRR